MSDAIDRRTFIKTGTVLGASALFSTNTLGVMEQLALAGEQPEMAAVTGDDPYQDTLSAVELIGGIRRYVPRQTTVGLLVNSPFRHPGSFVKPEITLAVIHLCLAAGAKEIGVFKDLSAAYWRRGSVADRAKDEVRGLADFSGNFRQISIPQGRSLPTAEVPRSLLECEVFINVSIAKDHTGTRFSGIMKNMMGALASSTNRFFHFGSGQNSGWYENARFLSQCIADVNLVRAPSLCILDGTEILKTNGPSGPGELRKPRTVLAGTDRVALDGYGASLLGLRPDDILTVKMAHEHGLGEIDLSRVKVDRLVKSPTFHQDGLRKNPDIRGVVSQTAIW
ncbi:MAG: DUF362 domain-containing protein [Desulfopila sp.]